MSITIKESFDDAELAPNGPTFSQTPDAGPDRIMATFPDGESYLWNGNPRAVEVGDIRSNPLWKRILPARGG